MQRRVLKHEPKQVGHYVLRHEHPPRSSVRDPVDTRRLRDGQGVKVPFPRHIILGVYLVPTPSATIVLHLEEVSTGVKRHVHVEHGERYVLLGLLRFQISIKQVHGLLGSTFSPSRWFQKRSELPTLTTTTASLSLDRCPGPTATTKPLFRGRG